MLLLEKEKTVDSIPSPPISGCLCEHDALVCIPITGADTYLEVHANLYGFVEQLLLQEPEKTHLTYKSKNFGLAILTKKEIFFLWCVKKRLSEAPMHMAPKCSFTPDQGCFLPHPPSFFL